MSKMKVVLVVLAFAVAVVKGQNKTINDPDDYLERYGYLKSLPPGSKGQHSYAARRKAIKEFQHMARLPETGLLDKETRHKMAAPRCGMPDKKSSDPDPRVPQAYNTYNKWSKNKLTWKILDFTPDMPQDKQRTAFRWAFKYWSDVSNLEFRQVSGNAKADFQIGFGPYEHGCGYPFDGEGGTLAHCFYPTDSRAHFDESETWTEGVDSGTNLRIVAAHEFGHGLGLSHSEDPTSLMAPFYQGYESMEKFKLRDDDIAAIQSLYGRNGNPIPEQTTPKPNEPKTMRPGSGPCDSSFDAIISTPDGLTYAFQQNTVYRLSDRGVERKADIRDVLNPEPNRPVQAAVYEDRTESAFIFTGQKLWRYRYNRNRHQFKLENGYPKDYSRRSDYPRNPEAAMVDHVGWVVIFEGDYFWQFNVDSNNNKKYRTDHYFQGAPRGVIDSATRRGNTNFIFQGRDYYTKTGDGPIEGPNRKDRRWMGC